MRVISLVLFIWSSQLSAKELPSELKICESKLTPYEEDVEYEPMILPYVLRICDSSKICDENSKHIQGDFMKALLIARYQENS